MLHNLTELKVNCSALYQLPHAIGNLHSLVQLELRENFLLNLPDSICELKNLKHLDLEDNRLDHLPDDFGALVKLEELLLDKNHLSHLPISFGHLRSLQSADLCLNQIEKLPDNLSQLCQLELLNLSKNFLEELPESIGSLSKLSILKVDQNKLLSVTASIGQCTNLTELILNENLLESLPASIGQLDKLINLVLDSNRLKALPDELVNCRQLRMLHLRENNIVNLSDNFGALTNLRVLDVAENNLQYLPVGLKDVELRAVWLSENQNQPLVRFTEESVVHNGHMKEALMCYMLPQTKKTQEVLLRRSVIYSDDQPALRRSTEYTHSRLSVTFNMNENEVSEDYGTFTRKSTPHNKQLKEMENIAKNLVKEPDTMKKMVSSSSLASHSSSNKERNPGVHDSIDEVEEEEEDEDDVTHVPDIVDEDYKDVEIVKPLDCIDKSLIRSKSPSPRVKMRTKKSTPETTPQAQRLSLIELTKLTREMGNSIERTLDTVSSLPKVTIPAAKDEQQRQERRKLSNELDEIIETCHAHLTDMIDEMEANVTSNQHIDQHADDDEKKLSMTSLIVPSEISQYNSYRTSIFTDRTYASSLSSLSDDDDFMCLHISDDDDKPVTKLSRRSSRVKSLNQAQHALDDAIQLLAENITKRVMDEAQVIMRAKESTHSLDSAYETVSLPRTPTDSFNNLTDQIAHQIVNEAIRKAQHQIQTVQHYTSSIDVVNEENNDKDDNEQSLQVIATEIVNNAIITAKNKVHHHL